MAHCILDGHQHRVFVPRRIPVFVPPQHLFKCIPFGDKPFPNPPGFLQKIRTTKPEGPDPIPEPIVLGIDTGNDTGHNATAGDLRLRAIIPQIQDPGQGPFLNLGLEAPGHPGVGPRLQLGHASLGIHPFLGDLLPRHPPQRGHQGVVPEPPDNPIRILVDVLSIFNPHHKRLVMFFDPSAASLANVMDIEHFTIFIDLILNPPPFLFPAPIQEDEFLAMRTPDIVFPH